MIIALLLCLVLICWLLYDVHRLKLTVDDLAMSQFRLDTQVNQHSDNLVSLSLNVSGLRSEMDDCKDKAESAVEAVEALEEKLNSLAESEREELLSALEKKWDDAVAAVTNYDPYRTGENK